MILLLKVVNFWTPYTGDKFLVVKDSVDISKIFGMSW